eukprot:scaffold13470_cov186-Alexandrium_tamarense.AAC.2
MFCQVIVACHLGRRGGYDVSSVREEVPSWSMLTSDCYYFSIGSPLYTPSRPLTRFQTEEGIAPPPEF